MILGAALLAAACGPRPSAQVEKVELCSVVGDYGLEADAIEITVSNPRSLKGLKAEDFDLVNNVPAAFIDAATVDGVEIVLSGVPSLVQVKDNISFAKSFIPLSSGEHLHFDAEKPSRLGFVGKLK